MSKDKLVVNNNMESMAIELGYDPSKIVTKTNNKSTSTNGNCKEVEDCRNAMNNVYIQRTKVYQVETLKLGKEGQVIRTIKEVRGFLDKHPTNSKLDCIRELNIFAPYSKDKVTPCYKSLVKIISD